MSNEQQITKKDNQPAYSEDAATFDNKYCEAPLPMTISDCSNCMKWYFINIINKPTYIKSDEPNIRGEVAVNIQFEVVYEFSLCLKGRQPGKLLYTTSLIPQEELKIYVSDRYRKSTSAEACFSVHSSFRASVSALHESRQSGSTSSYSDNLKKSSDSSGASASFLGIFGGSESQTSGSSSENMQSMQSAFQNFQQTLVSASSSVEAQRSLVVSSYEDHENLTVTSRTLKNYNNCHAVTYYVRQVNEAYELSAKIASIRWRIVQSRLSNTVTDWQSINDIDKIQNEELQNVIKTTIGEIEERNRESVSERCFTLPTDGTMLETELAYCSSCDDERMMELEVMIEKQKAETKKLRLESELLLLEIELKKKQLAEDTTTGS